MAQGNLQIHTENILPIIKKWLYSDRDVFVRELVSNACDAMQKCRVLRENKELEVSDADLKLEITVDKEKKTITFGDSGIGMTADEVEKYIAKIAFSGAEEFVAKYKGCENTDAIIGHFGLGFYSAYMVADRVVIDTLSYQQSAQAALWSCEGGSTYLLEEGTQKTRGTSITLFIAEESLEYLEETKLRAILNKYCAFLPFPIYLNGNQINKKEPLWLKNPNECTLEEYKEFFSLLYPLEEESLFSVHLNVDYPFHLKGILYFPRITPSFDWNKSHIQLFCNRVFVSDNCKDLLPDYLTQLLGAIDSPDIPLNVSRSFLQMDRTVRQVGSYISKKIADKLTSLFEKDKEEFIKIWKDVEIFVKLGCLQDEKFYEKVKEILLWKTLSHKFLTTEELLLKTKPISENKIFYTSEEKLSSQLLSLYKHKEIEIAIANPHIDTALMSFLESKIPGLHFQRIDGGIDEALVEKQEQNKEQKEAIEVFFKQALGDETLDVEAKPLISSHLPGMIVLEENARRFRDYMAFSKSSMGQIPSKKTFVVNTSSQLIQKLISLKEKEKALADSMAKHVYELSLLSQKELSADEMTSFIERSGTLLQQLSEKL